MYQGGKGPSIPALPQAKDNDVLERTEVSSDTLRWTRSGEQPQMQTEELYESLILWRGPGSSLSQLSQESF